MHNISAVLSLDVALEYQCNGGWSVYDTLLKHEFIAAIGLPSTTYSSAPWLLFSFVIFPYSKNVWMHSHTSRLSLVYGVWSLLSRPLPLNTRTEGVCILLRAKKLYSYQTFKIEKLHILCIKFRLQDYRFRPSVCLSNVWLTFRFCTVSIQLNLGVSKTKGLGNVNFFVEE